MRGKTFLAAGASCLLCLAAVAGIATGKAGKTAVVIDAKPALSGDPPNKRIVTTRGHLVASKACRRGRLMKLLRTDSAGTIQTEGNVARTTTARNGTFTLTGELKSDPKEDDRLLVMARKSRRPDGTLKCRGARSELLTIVGATGPQK